MTRAQIEAELGAIKLLLQGWAQQRNALDKSIAFFSEKESALSTELAKLKSKRVPYGRKRKA
jgi:hypothetical protein